MGPINGECKGEQGIFNFWKRNKTMMGPIQEECGVGQGIINTGERNKNYGGAYQGCMWS